MVIEGSITSRLAFQLIIEIKNDFREGHFKYQFHPGGSKVTLVDKDSALAKTQRHDIAYIFGLRNDLRFDKRFFNTIQLRWIRHFRWIIHSYFFSPGRIGNEAYVRNGGDHRLVEFPFQSFLDDLHVQHPEKAATEP